MLYGQILHAPLLGYVDREEPPRASDTCFDTELLELKLKTIPSLHEIYFSPSVRLFKTLLH